MTAPNSWIRKRYDTAGKLRLVLRRGRVLHGSFAHFFDARGRRVDRRGRPVRRTSVENFAPIVWDLTSESAPHHPSPSSAPTLDEAVAVARESPAFRTWFDEITLSGWSIEIGDALQGATCEKGPDRILIGADRRGAMVADLVHEVALARALAAPLPILDRGDPHFVRTNARHLLTCHAEAKLNLAMARDEVLSAGGPDIGGQGLRGSQLDAYYAWREGKLTFEEAKAIAAFSCDADEARGFTRETGPVVATHLAEFLKVPASNEAGRGLLQPVAKGIIDRLGELPSLTAAEVATCLATSFAQAPSFQPSVFRWRAVVEGAFVAAELWEVRGAGRKASHRLVLTPAPGASVGGLWSSLGPGVPHHVGARATDRAMTLAYPRAGTTLFVTSGVADGALIAVTLQSS